MRFCRMAMPIAQQFSGRGINGIVGLFVRHTTTGGFMKRALAVTATLFLLSCASQQLTREQTLVNKAIDAMGGAERIAAVQSAAAKGTTKQWEPEQSDAPGGEMRFANETSFDVVQERKSLSARSDIERRFAYPSPRTFKFTEI